MIKHLFLFLFLLIGLVSFGQVESKISIPVSAYPNKRPALLQLPDDYASTATKYALLVFGHGKGERSNTGAADATYQAGGYLNNIYNSAGSGGPAYFIEQGSWPSSFTNPVDGLQYKFIVLSPQHDSWSVYSGDVKDIISWMVTNYRVDTNRIYTTGLSAGGEETAMGYEAEYDIEAGLSIAPVRYKPAAVLLMSPQTPTSTIDPAWIATSVTDSVPNWGFGSPSNDPYGQRAKDFIDGQNAIKANYSRFTTYASGHCCWNTFYNPSYTEVIGGQTMNLYQWLLTKKRNASIPNTTGIFTFTLASTQRTSAAVYKSDSTLVRTLWADSTFTAGTYTRYWDGKDDYGVTISSPDANYYIRVLTNNVVYNWDGIIGNTSSSNTGAGVHRGYYTSMTGMAITGTTAYFTQGYSEAISSQAKFSTTSPQVRVSLTGFGGRVITMNADYVVTDGTAVYWAGYDGFNSAQNFVMATSVATDAQISFGANGSSYTVTNGKTYTSTIDKLNAANSKPTGLAVGATYLFVSHGGLNQLHVINKTTGALAQNLTFTNPRCLSVEGSNLWMVSGTNTVAKYTINANGTLSAATLTLAGITTPGAIATNGGNIAVIDAGTNQIVRFFNTTTGVAGTSLGTLGGYNNSPDVTNTKFMFGNFRLDGNSYLAYAPDGSFWVGDGGNYRNQHFSASKTYIETIMSMGADYSTNVDPNNITRVFGNYLEFAINYAQPITGSTGWTLAKNWGFVGASTNGSLTKMSNIVTLSNGRTYGFVVGVGYSELTATGPRNTGLNPSGIICQDGGRQVTTGSFAVGGVLTVTKYPLTGFDGSNNPVWSASGTVIATTPPNTLQLPATNPQTEALTSTNKVVFYQTETYLLGVVANMLTGHHLGAIKKGGNTYLWKNQKADHRNYQGSYPKEDYYEIGNGVNDFSGSRLTIVDRNLFAGHHDEFWKGGQTNYYNHYLDDGMPIGQFGQDFYAITHNQNIYPQPPYGFAGNALTPQAVKDGSGNIFLYHGDESYHAGVHRWSITNLASIAEQTIVIPFPSTYTAPAINYVDLHAGLPFDQTLTSSAGWTKTGTVAYYTNRKKYANDGRPDVFSQFVPPYTITSGTASTQRDLGSNNVTSNWAITTNISYEATNVFNTNAKMYVEVLDATGKILARLFYTVSGSIITLKGNTATIVSDAAVADTMFALKPLEIKCANGLVTFTYASYAPVSASIFDASGNWKTPKTLRTFVTFAPASSDIATDLQGSRLYLDIAATSAIYYISTSTGDDARTATQAQNQATPWKTIGKVNSSFSTFNAGDQVLFKAGEVFNGTLKVTKSGGLNNPITFGSYGAGAKPVINGLTTLSGWVNLGGGIWESPAISTSVNVSMLAINSQPYAMGRFPNYDTTSNRGYLYFQTHNSNISITSNAVNSSVTNWTGAELVLRSKRFELDRYTITSHSAGTLTHAAAGAVPTDNFGFFIQNDVRTLDAFGEWYYNPVSKKVRIFTGGSAPSSYTIQVNTLDTLASIRNFDNITLNNLSLKGGGLRSVDLYTASNIKITNCDISLSGADAVFGAFTTNLSFTNNTITNSNSSAMDLTNACNSSTIQNNVIRNSGTFAGMGNNTSHAYSGIVLIDGVNNLIDHNTIDSTGFAPVRFFGNTNSVQYNYISNFGYIMDDVGGVYIPLNGADSTAAVTQSGISINHNVISNGTGAAWGTNFPGSGSAHGIYFDNNVNNVTVDNNSVFNCFATGMYAHNDKNITVTNNAFFGNGIAFQSVHDVANQFNTRGLIINNNKFVGQTLTDKAANFKTTLNDINLFGTINNNIYARPLDDNLTITTTVLSSTTTQRNLAGWQVFSGHDAASTKSPRAITDTSQIIYRSNPPNSTVTLAGNWIDLKSAAYSGTVSLGAYSSIVLIPAPITKITPTITWINSLSKVYPAPITSGDLNATGSVPGVITYNTSAGTIYNPGTYTLTATLTPTDTATYNIAIKNITLTVTFSTGQKVCIGPGGDGGIYFFNHQNYLGNVININPGDTLCINAGTYMYVQLNGLVGTAAKPIVIINEGGQVINTGNNGTSYCYLLNKSRFFKFTGTGSASVTYGFKAQYISGGIPRLTGVMISVRDSSTDYEIDHMQGDSVGNGFILKIDPADCTPASWRGNWVIRNVKVHDNYIHGSTGEVVYAMNTDQFTVVKNCSNVDTTILPVPGINWEIYNNHFDSSGWDGIQVASCSGCSIHDNYVHNYGTKDIGSQQAGIILGGRSYGSIYNNTVIRGTGNGIEYYGWGKDTLGVNAGKRADIYNNIIDSVGTSNNPKQDAIYWDSRPAQSDSMTVYIFNNTITRPGRYGVNTFNSNGNQAINKSKVNNNLIVNPGSNYLNQPSGFVYDTTFNQRIATIAAANFTNYAAKNFLITGASPAFDAGKNLSAYLTTDIIGTNRPQNVAYDDGAYEFIPSGSLITPTITWANPSAISYPTPLSGTQLNATANAAGTFAYSPASGTILTPGTQTLNVTFTPSDPFTYTSASKSVTIVVNKGNATLTQSNLNQTYTGSPLPITVTTSPAGLTVVDNTYNGAASIPVNAGSYTVVSGLTNANYQASPVTGTYIINKAAATLTLSNLNQVYDGSPKPITVTTSPAGLSGVSVTYNGSGTVPTNAGSYTVVATLTNTNYQASSVTSTLVIAKATPIVTWANPSAITYGTALSGTQLNASASVAGSFVYTPSSGTILNAGTQLLSVDFTPTDGTNYKTVLNTTVTIVVNKAVATISLSNLAQVYNGAGKSATATTSPAGLNVVTITYDGSPTLPINAGSYAVVASLNNSNYTASNASGTLVISKAIATITLSGLSQIYNGTQRIVTATTAPAGLTVVSITYNGSSTPPTNAGSYPIVATLTNSNYQATNATGTLFVDKATPVISWSNPTAITYGTALSGTQLNATSGGVAGTFTYNPPSGTVLNAGTQILSVNFAPTDAANYYPVNGTTVTIVVNKATATITLSNLAQDYDGTPKPVTVTVSPNVGVITVTYNGSTTAPSAVGTYAVVASLSNTNYTATNATGNLVISNPPGNVAITNINQTYTGSPLPVTVTTSPGAYSTAVTYNGSGTVPTNAGTYTVIATINDGIHVGADTATYIILKATPVISWSNPSAITYGTALSGTQLNASSATAGTFTYTPASGSILNAGTQILSVTFAPTDGANYNNASATVSLVVNKAVATLTLSNLNQVYDGTPKSAIATTSPVGLDVVTILYDDSPTPPTAVGSYSVSASLVNANYTATTVLGTLVISASSAGISISNTNQTYTGSPLPVTVTTNPTGLTYTVTYNGSATVPTNAGSYTVIATLTGGSYTGADTQTLVINKQVPVLTWAAPSSIVYGTALSGTQLNATSNVAGTLVYSPLSGAVLNAGIQNLTVSFTPTDAANYTSVNKIVTITVTQASATLNLSGLTQTYDGTPKPVTVSTTPTGLSGVTVTYNGSSSIPTNAGSYDIIVTLTNTNYTASPTGGTLVIAKASPILSWAIPAPISQGTPLSATQLNATSNIAGTFTYNPTFGYVIPIVGTQSITATFTPTDAVNYNGGVIFVPMAVYGQPFLDYFIRHGGGTIYLNLY